MNSLFIYQERFFVTKWNLICQEVLSHITDVSRSFRFRVEDYDLCVYGVFDGFGGAQVSDYVTKRLPAELVLGQLEPDLTGHCSIIGFLFTNKRATFINRRKIDT